MGEKLQKLIEEFLEVARARKREEHIQNLAKDVRNLIIQQTEDMDVYVIDPQIVENQIKNSDESEKIIRSSPPASGSYEYDVAFSFAGEKRDYVQKVALHVENKGIHVFYDDFQEIDIWGKNLIDYLEDIFKNKAKYCVMFISKEYAEKAWPNFERQIIQARSMVESGYMLPVRFDDTDIKGLVSTIKYINISSVSPEELGEMLTQKITPAISKATAPLKDITPEMESPDLVPPKDTGPILYVNPSVARSGGPKGHFVRFVIRNIGKEIALDVTWGIRGFSYEWRPEGENLFILDPSKEKEVIYPISEQTTFLKEVPELNIFMEYKDAKGTMFFSRRELKQERVPSGAFYDLKVGAFHPPTVLINDGVDFNSGPIWNGDRIEGKFQIQSGDQLKIVTIGISRTFLSTWGFTEIDFIKQAILELGFRKVRKMIKENKVEDYIFISDNFPQEYQNGIKGYQLLRDSL
ncbi:MAG: TIR domain-containing protein [Candidatus Levybacteria bacterium]|nr:TIR domain-containing protein [Candidatus Levybacteria bacterium]